MIKTGIIGAGFGKRIIGSSLLNNNNFKIYGIFSRNRRKAKKAKKELSADYYYEDWQNLIDGESDLICVAIPPYMHFEVAKYALENDKHVVLTSPYCLDVERGEELAKIAENRQLQTAVLHYLNYLPARNYAVNLLKAGKIGSIVSVERTFKNNDHFEQNYEHPWHYIKKLGGGLLKRQGSHDVDYLLRILGGVKKVSASTETFFKNFWKSDEETFKYTADDWFKLDIQFHKGPKAYIEVNGTYPGRPVNEFVFYGTDGILLMQDDKELSYFNKRGERKRLAIPPRYQMVNLQGPKETSPIYMLMETLAEAIKSNGNNVLVSPSFSEAVHTQRVIQTAENAMKAQQWMEIGSETKNKQKVKKSGPQIDKIYE